MIVERIGKHITTKTVYQLKAKTPAEMDVLIKKFLADKRALGEDPQQLGAKIEGEFFCVIFTSESAKPMVDDKEKIHIVLSSSDVRELLRVIKHSHTQLATARTKFWDVVTTIDMQLKNMYMTNLKHVEKLMFFK